jgi:predicted dehydrogenase
MLNFAIIGCGRVGRKRLSGLGDNRVAVACDLDLARAQAVVNAAGSGRATTSFANAIADPGVDAVIVATLNAKLAEISLAALQEGKHVLIEKPAALTAAQLDPLIVEAEHRKLCARVGYNHRYHPAFQKAREIFDSGELGELMFIRGRYGHGGRLGYEKEWRADPTLSGGGELIDQGIHLIDLSRWFLGDFATVEGHLVTYFWKMPVDDNAFVSLRTTLGQTAWLQASCTEWKNLFSFEIYGQNAKLLIEGLGGSYGIERLYYYRMRPEMGPPDTSVWEFPGEDDSWAVELREFVRDVCESRIPSPGLRDARAALEIVDCLSGKEDTASGDPNAKCEIRR